MNLQDFLSDFHPPGKILFAKLWGSRSHNCHKPDSDWDFCGVYASPLKDLLSIDSIDGTYENNGEGMHYQFHEAWKFCRLLLKGNPGITEQLWTDRFFVDTAEWRELVLIRDKFLSKKSISQYLGYAEGQLNHLRSGKCLHTSGCTYNEKWAYHLLRLLGDARRIAEGSPPVVWKEGAERAFLMEVRSGKLHQTEVQELAEKKIQEIRNMEWLVPDEGNKDALNAWLLKVRGI